MIIKKATLKLYEILNLEVEVNGLINGNRVLVEGLLNQNIDFSLKYHLNSYISSVRNEKKIINDIQDEFIKKYGTVGPDGNLGLDRVIVTKDNEGNIKEEINPNFISYQQEWNEFLNNNEKDIEFPELTLNDLKEVKTKDNYITLMKYFIKQPE